MATSTTAFKAIKVTKENEAAINSALKTANGKATGHTYTEYSSIAHIAAVAEKKLELLLGGKANWAGAVVNDRSGDELPNAYKYKRICTSVKLVRKSAGWYLDSVKAVGGYSNMVKLHITLTKAQDELAVKRVRASYTVAAE